MPLEVCQSAKALNAKRHTPCLTCTYSVGCRHLGRHRQIIEHQPKGRRQISIITKCDYYRPQSPDAQQTKDIRLSLYAAGVNPLCRDCMVCGPQECVMRTQIEEFQKSTGRSVRQGKPHGTRIVVTMISCFTCHEADELHQISDPKK